MSNKLAKRAAEELVSLAVEIREEHEAGERDVVSAVERFAECGRMLLEAKGKVEHGQWIPWVRSTLPFDERQAQKYMRITREPSNTNSNSHLSLDAALAELAEPRPPTIADGRSPVEHLANEATWSSPGKYRQDAEAEVVDAEIVDELPVPAPEVVTRFTGYGSATDEWATPQDLFDELDAEFKFELDVCALDSSAKCPTYFTPETDGLSKDWKRFRCWMNPPYGEAIGDWMTKAVEEADKGATVVCLVPARTDTAWWFDNCPFGEIRFIRGRLKFGESTTSAPFPSAVVIFGPGFTPTVKWWAR